MWYTSSLMSAIRILIRTQTRNNSQHFQLKWLRSKDIPLGILYGRDKSQKHQSSFPYSDSNTVADLLNQPPRSFSDMTEVLTKLRSHNRPFRQKNDLRKRKDNSRERLELYFRSLRQFHHTDNHQDTLNDKGSFYDSKLLSSSKFHHIDLCN